MIKLDYGNIYRSSGNEVNTMEDNNNFQENPMNNAGVPVTPPVYRPVPDQPVYQQQGAQQVYYTRPVTPVPNGYGMYAQPVRPAQPVRTAVPVQQVQTYPVNSQVIPSVQPVQAGKTGNASPEQNNSGSGNGGKRSIVMPVIFSVALALLFMYTLAQSFYIVRLNKKISATTAAPEETTINPDESQPEESGEPSESEEPEETREDGKPWFSIGDGAVATDPNKKAMRTTDIVAESSPATIPVYILKGSKKVASGTGFIISTKGYIVTNAHVVQYVTKSPDSYSVTVLLHGDENETPAEIVGTDVQTDIAVLKVTTDKTLPCVRLGDSDKLQCGELVIAIGNALGQLDDTVTVGVVSGTNREISNNGYRLKVIQTDAAINNGNSGGPLINSFGEVVGITNAKIVTATSEGLGFAIPINSVKGIIEKLINYGKVTDRPYLGLSVKYYEEGQYKDGVAGVYVSALTSGGPSEKAGLKIGDRLISLGGVEIKKSNDIIDVRDSHKVGDTIEAVVERDGTTNTYTIVIGDSGDFEESNTTKPTEPTEPSRRNDRDDDDDYED